MPLDTWLASFVASWLISLSPDAGAVSSMSAGMRFGYRRALWNRVLRLLRAPRRLRAMNRAVGGLFVVTGAFLATFRRAL